MCLPLGDPEHVAPKENFWEFAVDDEPGCLYGRCFGIL